MRERLLQFKNMLVKPVEEVTAVVTNAGTDASELQPLSILLMFVTEDVSNKGTDVSEKQF